MKKLLYVLALTLGASCQARAQVFRPGWVLPAQGDTLRGELEDVDWQEAPTRVRFRPAAGAAITAYAPAEVRAFRLAGGRYFRYETLPLDREAQTSLGNLKATVQRNPQPETFLVEVLVDGPASLRRTAVNSVRHYYVQRTGQPVLELAERKYLRQDPSGTTTIASANNYRAELTQYFGSCPAAVQAIGAFEPAALVRVVQAYNRQCATPPGAGTEYRPAQTRRLQGLAVGLVAGGRYNSCQLHAEQPGASKLFDGTNLDGTVHPIGGLYADVAVPSYRLALHASVMVTQLGRQAEYTTSSSALTAQLDNRLTLLETRLGVRYFWANTRQELHFFLGSGVTIPVGLGRKSGTLTYYNANQQPQQHDDLLNAYPSGLLPYLEVGVQKGRFTLALDGRTQQRPSDFGISVNVPQSSGILTLFTYTTYSGRSWYAGATVGWALLWHP